MGRLSTSLAVFALLAAAATGLSACGGGGDAELLPGATASQIDSNLNRVEQLVAEGECAGAEASAAEISSQVEGLEGVDAKLQRALAEGAARLTENVASECEEEESDEEEIPSVEQLEEAEPEEKEKPEKPDKAEKEEEKEQSDEEKPTLPPNSNGKGEEKGKGEVPPVEPSEEEEQPSGGVGPGTAVEGESD
jgi:hypothetical protein